MSSGESEPEDAGETPPAGDAGDGEDAPEARGTCELCSGPTYERHCKIVCLRCGYVRDCSDP